MAYSEEKKQHALARLAANGGNLRRTSAELKISTETLRRWRDAAPSQSEPSSVLEQLEAHMAAHALKLAKNLLSKEESVPLNQRASALGMLVDRLLKLDALKQGQAPDDTNANTIEIVYRGADGQRYNQPDWQREGTDDANRD